MDEDALWVTSVVDRRGGLDKREERRQARARKLGILWLDPSGHELGGNVSSPSPYVANIQEEEGVKKTSAYLQSEIVALGEAGSIRGLRRTGKRQGHDRASGTAISIATGPVDAEDFLQAAAQGKLATVKKFLEDGGEPDTCDEFRKTALHRAAYAGHVGVMETLLDRGADIKSRDRLDSRAVHWASRGGCLAALRVLQDRGADLNVRDKLLSTPLHMATRIGHWHIVEHLLASGVKINAKDREGDTALHDAVRLNRYRIVKLLIMAGADMSIKNAEGVTATEQVKLWQFDTKETLEKLEQMELV